MFADNGKISPGQAGCLLFTDWVGKLLLLLPRISDAKSGWEFLAAVALGGVWTFLYAALLIRLSRGVHGSYTGFLSARIGKGPAYLAGALGLLYLLVNLTYLARLAGRICRVFLLPEVPETLIALCALAAGAATASRDGQKRARAAEFLFWPVAVALGIMLAASVGSVKISRLLPSAVPGLRRVFGGSGGVFAGFSGVALILYEIPHVNWGGRRRMAAVGAGLALTLLFLLATFLAALGVLGEGGFSRLPWPVVTLMGSACLPGGFLQRWDAVFLAFLLFALLLGCGASCHYMKRVTSELLPKKNRERLLFGAAGLAFLAVCLTRSFENAQELFVRLALCGLAPLLTAVPVLLMLLERIKKKCGK